MPHAAVFSPSFEVITLVGKDASTSPFVGNAQRSNAKSRRQVTLVGRPPRSELSCPTKQICDHGALLAEPKSKTSGTASVSTSGSENGLAVVGPLDRSTSTKAKAKKMRRRRCRSASSGRSNRTKRRGQGMKNAIKSNKSPKSTYSNGSVNLSVKSTSHYKKRGLACTSEHRKASSRITVKETEVSNMGQLNDDGITEKVIRTPLQIRHKSNTGHKMMELRRELRFGFVIDGQPLALVYHLILNTDNPRPCVQVRGIWVDKKPLIRRRQSR